MTADNTPVVELQPLTVGAREDGDDSADNSPRSDDDSSTGESRVDDVELLDDEEDGVEASKLVGILSGDEKAEISRISSHLVKMEVQQAELPHSHAHSDGLCGFLLKKGGKSSSGFKRRWFSVSNGRLLYDVTQDSAAPRGIIELRHVTKVGPLNVGGSRLFRRAEQTHFVIVTASRTYLLRAATHNELVKWVNGLNQEVYRAQLSQKRETGWDKLRRLTPSQRKQLLAKLRRQKSEEGISDAGSLCVDGDLDISVSSWPTTSSPRARSVSRPLFVLPASSFRLSSLWKRATREDIKERSGTSMFESDSPLPSFSTMEFERQDSTTLSGQGSSANTDAPIIINEQAWQKGREFALSNVSKDKDGSLLPVIPTPISRFKEHGVGVYTYMYITKSLSLVFLAMFLVVLPVAVFNQTKGPMPPTPSSPACLNGTDYTFPATLTLGHLHVLCDDPGRVMVPWWYGALDACCTLIFFFYWLYLAHRVRSLVTEVDKDTVTSADYTVMVNGLPPDATDNSELKSHFKCFGEVLHVAISKNDAELVETINKRTSLQALIRNIGLRQQILGNTLGPEEHAKLEQSLHKAVADERLNEEKFARLQNSKRVCTGFAFVTFNFQHSVNRCLEYPYMPSLFRGVHQLYCRRAPEPHDVMWQNLQHGRVVKIRQQLISSGFGLSLIALSTTCLDYTAKWGRGFPKDLFGALAAVLSTTIPIIAANIVIFIFIPVLAGLFERPHTRTGQELSVLLKLLFFQVLNTTVSSIFYLFDTQTHRLDAFWYPAGEMQVMNCLVGDIIIISFLIELLRPDVRVFRRRLGAKKSLTQHELNGCWEAPEFSEAFRYQLGLKFIFVGFIFSGGNPLLLLLCSLFYVITFWIDKYNLLRLYSKCNQRNDLVNSFIIRFLFPGAILMHLGCSAVFYYQGDPHTLAWMPVLALMAFIVLLLIIFRVCFVFNLFPSSFIPSLYRLNKTKRYTTNRQSVTSELRFWDVEGLDLYLPPLTALLLKKSMAARRKNTIASANPNAKAKSASMFSPRKILSSFHGAKTVAEESLLSTPSLPTLSEDEEGELL